MNMQVQQALTLKNAKCVDEARSHHPATSRPKVVQGCSLYSTTSCDRVVHGERLRHKRSGRSPSSRGCRPVPLASPPDGEAQTVISTATIEINHHIRPKTSASLLSRTQLILLYVASKYQKSPSAFHRFVILELHVRI
ncbi:predicted protein [Coccidioides posadasii str. Silveira]|uniref:Predicted protein n=1 Tax=Coccidioides posadasii (strain RMSCC 757 / Silveira) TaxID=443226 RepID=E9DA55_COCPS|nr:predicted protein [Coccidioides posadasii str. Silveira]